MSHTIGIDPGQSGALAIIDPSGGLLEVYDMPIFGEGRSGSVSARGVATILQDWMVLVAPDPVTIVIEDVHSMPKQGVASTFKFGRSKGVLEGAAASTSARLLYATPSQWKRDLKLSRDKGSSRKRATEQWPLSAGLFSRVKDDGRAEAALIALWGWEQTQ